MDQFYQITMPCAKFIVNLIFQDVKYETFISLNKDLSQVLQIINHTKHAEIGQSLLYTRHS